MTTRLLCLCTIALLFSDRPTFADAVDDYVASQMTAHHMPSVALAVLRDGEVVKLQAYGLANLELNSPARVDSVYQLASVTKPFAATAILSLVEESSLRLDDKISKYFDGTPESWSEITIAQLLSHTSGIKDYINEKLMDPARKYSDSEIVDLVKPLPLNFTPGEKWSYSNTNYHLLGMLIEKLSGKRFDLYLTERVFSPLGMSATGRRDLSRICPWRAAAYHWSGDHFSNARYLEPSQWDHADGGLVSSVADLARFELALSEGKVLRPETLELMWQPTPVSVRRRNRSYGLGWETGDIRGHRRVGHGGGRAGVSTYYARYLDERLAVIALTNCDNADVQRDIVEAIAGHYCPALLPLYLRTETADDDPATTQRLRELMNDVAAGNRDSKLVTAANRETVSEPQRRIARMLAESKGLLFLGAEDTSKRNLSRKGSRIATVRHYKILASDVTQYLTFYLTEEGLVADLDPEERPVAAANSSQAK